MACRQKLMSILVLGALFLGASISLSAPQEPGASITLAQAQSTQVQSATIPIEGMACMLCVGRVKKTLKAIDGVQEVTVSLEHRHAHLRYRETTVSPERLAAAINDLGYTAGTPTVEHTP